MGAVRGAELVIDRGEDVWVWDVDGRRYLDATASLWYANVGHGRRQIAAAVAEQLERLEAYSIFGDFANEPARRLADRLAGIAPVHDARVFLTSGGGDGIDTAAKLVRRYWAELGEPERTHIIGRSGSYHGTHGYGTSIGGIEANRVGWGPLASETSSVAHDSLAALAGAIERRRPERVAAVFVEPVLGAGGVHAPPPGYLEGVAELCRQTGVLLVVDAVICGFGRLGTWFGIERWGVVPDLIVFAKGVTSGYQPLGGVVVSAAVSAPFWAAPGAPILRHGPTYAGHPAACAAAHANLDILEGEGLLARGQELEGELAAALAPLADHPLVAEVRAGVGLMGAVELDAELLTGDPAAVVEVALAAREHGVLVRPLGNALAVSPPLTATPEHFELITGALSWALDELRVPNAERS
jgi:adenosylmethionine-8-amino-7-oxononanoate aminotransferase